MKKALLIATHLGTLLLGFVAGIYVLPILTATPPAAVGAMPSGEMLFQGQFRRDLKDSDFLHWGEGRVTLSAQAVSFDGKLAPGPDYKLYLSPEFVETEADFNRLKSTMLRVGDVRNFERFVLPLPAGADPGRYNTVIVWCETFGQFITAATYR